MRFNKSSCLHYIKVQSETAGAHVEAAVTYPEDLAKINGTYTNTRLIHDSWGRKESDMTE